MDANTIAWVATFAAMALSARLANAFLKSAPRLYTVMALFACSWAILLPYYRADAVPTDDMFRAISGFLLIYSGGLLMLEAQHRSGHARHDGIVPWQIAGLYFLLLIAAPPVGGRLHLFSERQAELAIGMLLDVTGFLSLTIGVWRLCGAAAATLLGLLLFAYVGGETTVGVLDWSTITGSQDPLYIPSAFVYGFAAGKLIIAATFGSLVVHAGMNETLRGRGTGYWLLKLFGFDPGPHEPPPATAPPLAPPPALP